MTAPQRMYETIVWFLHIYANGNSQYPACTRTDKSTYIYRKLPTFRIVLLVGWKQPAAFTVVTINTGTDQGSCPKKSVAPDYAPRGASLILALCLHSCISVFTEIVSGVAWKAPVV